MLLIVNWSTVRGLKFSGDGLKCFRLFHTSDRQIVLGDNIVFLYCPQCVFTPENPSSALFLVTHVLYTVVHIRGSVFYLDRLDVLYKYVVMEPLVLKIAYPYVGIYILFSQSHDAGEPLTTVSSPSLSHQQQSDSAQHRSSHPQVRPSTLQQRPSAHTLLVSRSTTAATGNLGLVCSCDRI